MFNLFAVCSKKVLKTGEMFNMFNPEGEYGKGIEHGPKKLNIFSSSHALFESTNFKKCLKQGKCSICSIFLRHLPKKVLKTGEMFNMFNMFHPEGKYGKGIEHEYFPSGLIILNILNISPVLSTFLGTYQKGLNILSISPVLGTFRNFILYFQVFWHL